MNFWYMQLHPGTEAYREYGTGRLLSTLLRWQDIGMGDESQWTGGGEGIRKRFREVMAVGDVVALGKGRQLFALVRVTGEAKVCERCTEDHWYKLRRKVEVLSTNPEPCFMAYIRSFGTAPAEGLSVRQTLARVATNRFVKYWYEHLDLEAGCSVGAVSSATRPEKVSAVSQSWIRDAAVVQRALKARRCGNCGTTVTFARRDGGQYFEAHHLIPMAQQGAFARSLDVDANVICLCPTCHRFFHHGEHRAVKTALVKIYEQRAKAYKRSGLVMSKSTFLEYAR